MKHVYVLFFFVCSLCAVEVRDAAMWFDANEYARAQEAYERALEERLQPWEEAEILFNLGTVALAQGKWETAISQFTAISAGGFPFIQLRVKTNLALARLGLAKAASDQAIDQIQQALQDVQDAKEATCKTAELEGQAGCGSVQDLEEIRLYAKQMLAVTLQRKMTEQIEQTPWEEGVFLLLSGVNEVFSFPSYLNAKQWLPFWDAIGQKGESANFVKAKASFAQAVGLLKEDKPATEPLNQSRQELDKLIEIVWKDRPVELLLKQLLNAYRRVDPLQKALLEGLLDEQQKVIALLTEKETLKASNELLSSSVQFLQEGDTLNANLSFLEAQQQVRRLFWGISKQTPEAVLEQAIDEQQYILELQKLGKQQSQERVLLAVQPFLPAVMQKQEVDFEKRCQKKPWDEVFPLFFKGKKFAAAAMGDEALQVWKEALVKMHEPPVEEKQSIAFDEVLRLLQEMEQDDYIQKTEIKLPKRGFKPW